MTTAVRAPRRPDKTAAWTAAKILLFAGFVALGIAANIAWKPVVNPGVQDCGAPIAFFLQNRENVLLHPGEPGAPPNALALSEQPTCRDRAFVEIQKAGLATAAFFGLTLLGIIVGLLDDRIAYWSAPRYETLLRDMPRSARVEHGLLPNVDVDDLGVTLPPLETPEVAALVGFGLATFLVLPYVAIDAVRAAASASSAAPLLLGVTMAIVSFLAAATQRRALFPAGEPFADTVEVVMATSWVGRLRPVVGTFGIDIHHLRKRGLPRDAAVVDVQVLQTVSLAAHVLLLVLAVLLVARAPRPDIAFDRPVLVLAGALGLLLLSGVSRAVKRWRALAVRPGLTGLLGLPRVASTARQKLELVGSTLVLTAANVAVLWLALQAFTIDLPLPHLLLVHLVAVSLGALCPTPNGVGGLEAAMVLLLFVLGVDLGAAVCGTLAFRAVTFWLPMIPGIRASQRMRAIGAL